MDEFKNVEMTLEEGLAMEVPFLFLYAFPLIVLLVVYEFFLSAYQKRDLYHHKDLFASLGIGAGNLVLNVFTKIMTLAFLLFFYNRALWHIPPVWWSYILCFLLIDFCMYTGTLGPWAKSVFMVCALVVLYSTVFAAAASWTRIFTDAFAQLGLLDFYDRTARRRMFARLAWIFPAIWCVLFLFIQLPVLMILLGGFMTSVLLLLVVYAAFHFRYRRLPLSLKPSLFYDVAFWLSGIAILMVGVYGVYKLF